MPVGRPVKSHTLEKAYEDMNKCHDFWKMVDHYKSYDLQVESDCKSSPDADLGGLSNTRRRFTNQKKAEMRLHYSTIGNFCETARATWATFELSCRIRRLAYKLDPCFTGFEFSSVYFSPS